MDDEDLKCPYLMHDGKPCGRKLAWHGIEDGNGFYDSYCAFHSKNILATPEEMQLEFYQQLGDDDRKYCDFTGFKFPKFVWIFPNEINKDLYFNKCSFNCPISIDNIVVRKRLEFQYCIFNEDVTIEPQTTNDKIRFQGSVSFWKSEFNKKMRINRVNFSDSLSLSNCIIHGEVQLKRCKFKVVVSIDGTIFNSVMDLSGSEFKSSLHAEGIVCRNSAHLNSIKLLSDVFFNASYWDGSVEMKWSTIKKVLSFRDSRFVESLDLSFTRMDSEIIFSSCIFYQPSKITFNRNDLSKARFINCDIKSVNFLDVDWLKKGRVFKRMILFDEYIFNKLEYMRKRKITNFDFENEYHKIFSSYSSLADLYRQLQINYTNRLRYSEAGDFHIGEQEMLRKSGSFFSRICSIRSLYRISSRYGESYKIPLLWIVFIILLLFPLLINFNGIQYGNSTNEGSSIDYTWSWNPKELLLIKSDYWCDHWNAFRANVGLVSFNKRMMKDYLPTEASRFIVNVETILVIIFVTLFLLALRRKFKRKSF